MPKAAILIAASPNAAFYSQIAAISRALQAQRWTRWEPEILVSFGGPVDRCMLDRWLPYLRDIDLSFVSASRYDRDGDWAQCDEVFRLAPRNADLFVSLDADTLAVAPLEPLFERIHATGGAAGTIAHTPVPQAKGILPRAGWEQMAQGLLTVPLTFEHQVTLIDPQAAAAWREAPYYLNFGVVVFARACFDDIATRYLSMRPRLMHCMHQPAFSGQVALSFAILDCAAERCVLPMRYNFPNDPAADRRYPEELAQAAIIHYLRTDSFDRHRIFASEAAYRGFLALELTGSNAVFQSAVRRMLGLDYPFPDAAPASRAAERP